MDRKEKIWFLLVDGKKKGPYSALNLRWNPFVTPDTLVWREGFRNWIPLRNVSELKFIFEDSTEHSSYQPFKEKKTKILNDTLALDYHRDYTPLFFLLLLVLLVSYSIYRYYS